MQRQACNQFRALVPLCLLVLILPHVYQVPCADKGTFSPFLHDSQSTIFLRLLAVTALLNASAIGYFGLLLQRLRSWHLLFTQLILHGIVVYCNLLSTPHAITQDPPNMSPAVVL